LKVYEYKGIRNTDGLLEEAITEGWEVHDRYPMDRSLYNPNLFNKPDLILRKRLGVEE